jgi:hypothetical protein
LVTFLHYYEKERRGKARNNPFQFGSKLLIFCPFFVAWFWDPDVGNNPSCFCVQRVFNSCACVQNCMRASVFGFDFFSIFMHFIFFPSFLPPSFLLSLLLSTPFSFSSFFIPFSLLFFSFCFFMLRQAGGSDALASHPLWVSAYTSSPIMPKGTRQSSSVVFAEGIEKTGNRRREGENV